MNPEAGLLMPNGTIAAVAIFVRRVTQRMVMEQQPDQGTIIFHLQILWIATTAIQTLMAEAGGGPVSLRTTPVPTTLVTTLGM